MVSIEELQETTDEFFENFCREDFEKPKWSEKWLFKNTLPNNDKRGCYAHLINDSVVYIGLAIGKSYGGSGIGARVSKYWKKSTNYSITNPIYDSKINDINGIITLPFSEDNFYVAAALEVYLIQKLKGLRNKSYSSNK
jgi:hypothetical protein